MKFVLDNENIANACKKAELYFTQKGTEQSEIRRILMGMEETLLRYRDRLGGGEFDLALGGRFGSVKIKLTVPGIMLDPYCSGENDEYSSLFMRHAMASMGALPAWSYSHGNNIIQYSAENKGLPGWMQLLVSVVGALVVGFLLKLLPGQTVSTIAELVFAPLLNTFLGFINATAVPLMFFAIIWGIYSIGDVSTFSTIGSRLVGRFFAYLTAMGAATAALALPFFRLQMGASDSGGFEDVYRMLLDIVPGNVVKPFVDGNMLQILFIGTVVGIVMLKMGEATRTVAAITEQLGTIVQNIMSFISRLIPAFVFLSILNIILNSSTDISKTVYKPVLVTLGGGLFILAAETAIVCARIRISPVLLWKKAAETFVIGLSTASSAASFSTSLNTCTKKYGIKESLANFGVSMGHTLYKSVAPLVLFSITVYTAETAGIEVSASWLISALITSVILSAAAPSVPGGGMVCLSILFTQFGLPMERMGEAVTVNTVTDFFVTAVAVVGVQFLLILAADKFSMLDRNVLLKAEKQK